MKKTIFKGQLETKQGCVIIHTSGLHEQNKEKNLSKHQKEIVFLTIESEQKYKTLLQNNLFHKLVDIYLHSKMFDYSRLLQRLPNGFAELKIDIKDRLGVPSQEIKQRTDLVGLKEGQFIEIGKRVFYLQSWSKYTLTKARFLLDMLIAEMLDKGIDIDQQVIIYNEEINPGKVTKERAVSRLELDIF